MFCYDILIYYIGASLVNENEFMQWVTHIEAVTATMSAEASEENEELSRLSLTTTDEEDASQDLLAAFRVFDRDSNGFITKVNSITFILIVFIVKMYFVIKIAG